MYPEGEAAAQGPEAWRPGVPWGWQQQLGGSAEDSASAKVTHGKRRCEDHRPEHRSGPGGLSPLLSWAASQKVSLQRSAGWEEIWWPDSSANYGLSAWPSSLLPPSTPACLASSCLPALSLSRFLAVNLPILFSLPFFLPLLPTMLKPPSGFQVDTRTRTRCFLS